MPSKKAVETQTKTAPAEVESFESIARKTLESALALYAAGKSLATQEIRECVRKLVALAKSRDAQPERMLIELKQVWYSIAESGPNTKSEVISPLVTMCIREYYSADSEPSTG